MRYLRNGIDETSRVSVNKAPGTSRSPQLDVAAKAGAAHWAALHRAALDGSLTDAWFSGWERSIPSYGCTCRQNYEKKIKPNHRFRPDFAFTVELHNAVNRELGKPELTVDQAREVWAAVPPASGEGTAHQPHHP